MNYSLMEGIEERSREGGDVSKIFGELYVGPNNPKGEEGGIGTRAKERRQFLFFTTEQEKRKGEG